MANTSASLSSLADLFTQLFAFATANGWTQDQLDLGTGKAAIHKNSVYVSFRWDTATPANVGVYQALGYTGGNDPGNHPNDSGNGVISGTNTVLDDQRSVPLTNTPIKYWAFEDDHYVHVVVQLTTTTYVHFGFGELDKVGDWTGGEYAYGLRHIPLGSNNVAVQSGTTALLDGKLHDEAGVLSNAEEYAATLHVEGLPNEGGTSKWGVVMGGQLAANLGVDRAAVARVLCPGGFRAGPIAWAFGRFSATSEKGAIPMYPIGVFYRNKVTDTSFYFLGFMKDVRGINIEFHVGGDEIIIGADTWVVFPTYLKYTTTTIGTSGYQGIAYIKRA